MIRQVYVVRLPLQPGVHLRKLGQSKGQPT